MKCIQCLKEFEAKRVTAKYCSDTCRKLAFQDGSKVSVPGVSVPQLKTTKPTGICHGCGEDQGKPYWCICGSCVGKKVTHESLGFKMCEV